MIAKHSTDLARPDSRGDNTSQVPAGSERQQAPLTEVLWRRRWTVTLITIFAIVIAGVYLLQATRMYTSTSRIFVDQAGPKILATDATISKSDSYLYTQAQIIGSTPILNDAISKLDGGKLASVTFKDVDNKLPFLSKALKVEVGKKDDLITVSMDSAIPQEAANIVNAIVDSYVTFYSQIKKSSATEVLKILAKEREKTGIELSAKLEEMMKFKRDNGALSFETRGGGNIILERLAVLQNALTQCELEAADAKANFDTGTKMLATSEGIRRYMDSQNSKGREWEDGEYADMRADLRKYLMYKRQAGSIMGDNSKNAQAAENSIREIEGQLAAREQKFAEARMLDLRQRYDTAQAKETEIRLAFETQQKDALELNAKMTAYTQLQGDLDRLQRTCDLLDTRIKETNITEDGGALNIQVLEVARPEDKPTSPKKAQTLAIAMVLGLMLGSGTALIREFMDHRLRTAEEVTAALGIPVLGVVPHIRGNLSQSLAGQSVALDSMSEVAEAYRTIRTAVQFGTKSAEEVKTLLVTSPAAGDGKSTSASNIAIAFAQAGYRTLLIDCDLRKPVQHKIFEVTGPKGVTSVVAGESKLSESIHKTQIERLSVMACGTIPANPAELLNGKRFSRVMASLVESFDKIVIDSPPVMAVTDARILTAAADCTILVLRADKSTDRQSAMALAGLRSVGGTVLGVVMNDMPRRQSAYGYYTGYYYGHEENRSKLPTIVTDVSETGVEHDELELDLPRIAKKG